jgi:hypothetical protein
VPTNKKTQRWTMLPILNDSSLRCGPWSKGHTTRTLRSASALARLGLLAVYMPLGLGLHQFTDGISLVFFFFFLESFPSQNSWPPRTSCPTRDACRPAQDSTSSLLLEARLSNRIRQSHQCIKKDHAMGQLQKKNGMSEK